MQLFSFEYAHHQICADVTPWNGEETVRVDGHIVSQKRNFDLVSNHLFSLPDLGEFKLVFSLDLKMGEVNYQLWVNDHSVVVATAQIQPAPQDFSPATVAQMAPLDASPSKARSGSWLSLGLVAFKMLKAVKVVKVALAASTVAVYSVLFTVEFALALVAILVFHEYGHLRAMKRFGIPTKGMYLIPFIGGLAVGDRPRTQWQDVYISLMGPVFGLIMTLVFYLVYLMTENHFAGLVASTSALINLFNLIPVHPLDGGRVVKALVFSGRNYVALVALLIISALCFVLAWKLGLFFITFFIVLGVIDIVAGWRVSLAEDITPLKPYGIWFSLLWYLTLVGLFIGMILMIASDGLPGSEIALKVLSS